MATYEKVLDEAAKLFDKKGFDGTTTNEIARGADISIGSLYQYFDDKNAIADALTGRYVDALRALTQELAEPDLAELPVAEAVERFLGPILKFHLSYPEFRSLWLAADVSPTLREAIRAMDKEVSNRIKVLLAARIPGMREERAQVVTGVLHFAVKSLLALIGHSDDPAHKAQAATETKHMLTLYLESILQAEGA